ncbi:MAG: transposase [Calditrichaeota bacterium]|nr:MAG: transposase [Calditrichota bacterium]
MYESRKLSERERKALIELRKSHRLPWHSPPRFIKQDRIYMISAACFEHQQIINATPDRLEKFTVALLEFLNECCEKLYLWVVLPNHYHFVAHILDLDKYSRKVQPFHSINAISWNKEDERSGRKVFHSYSDRFMRSERHYWTTFNYIHNNPVKHGYVKKWQEWPCSSVHYYLEKYGYEKMKEIWFKYPLKNYGKGWDDWSS